MIMSRLYGDNHRALQEQFDSRRLADAIEKVAMETEVVGPHRLRLQGEATLHDDDPAMDLYKEADLIVRVKVSEIFVNCPRYVHKYQKVDPSRYVPRTECATPLAGWKHIDMIQEVLPARDQGRAEQEGGIITQEEWYGKVAQGDG